MAGVGSNIRKTARKIYRNVRWAPAARQIFDVVALKRRDHLLDKAYPDLYRKYSTRPVNPKKVIFVENNSREISDSFTAILDDLKKDGSYTVHVHFLEELTAGREGFSYNCARLAADAATAAYIFLNDYSNVISCLPLREETKVIQLWHACGAFKKFGNSTLSLKFGQTAKQQKKHPVYGYGNLDYVTVSSAEIAWAYTEAMQLEDKKTQVVATGISRTDRFFDPAFRESSARQVRERCPGSVGKKIVLYAPTFRGRIQVAATPDYTQFDLKALQQRFGNEFYVLVKHHPFVSEGRRPKMPEEMAGVYAGNAAGAHAGNVQGAFASDVTDTLSIETLLCAADVVITDYSSLIFEYSLMNRPMIFYSYDLDSYYDWRGFYYDYDEMTPGPVCRTMDELIEALAHVEEQFNQEQMAAFREKFMGACDGHATERIEKLMFGQSLR